MADPGVNTTIGKQVIGNASKLCYKPQAKGNQEVFYGSGYLSGSRVEVVYLQCWQKNMWRLFCVDIRFIEFLQDSGMHA